MSNFLNPRYALTPSRRTIYGVGQGPVMCFEEFQHLARLYVVGALESEEMGEFEEGRRIFGQRADDFVAECRRLESAFALSLQPAKTHAQAKARLLDLIADARRRTER